MASESKYTPIDKLEGGNAVLQTIQSCEDGRALKLLRQRQQLKDKVENAKNAIENETKKRSFKTIDSQYGSSRADAIEAAFAKETIGLQTADEFREKRAKVDELIRTGQLLQKEAVIHIKKKVSTAKLSFGGGSSDESEEERVPKKMHFGKDPTVETSFLPDEERDLAIKIEREQLAEEYHAEQEMIKKELLEITYSYWDGSGHRRTITVEKGFTMGQFLTACRKDLEKEFPELKGKGAESLLYIKEDLIIPNHVTFYELIKNKARGKSGPLFNFDVHEDIRMMNDSRVEKDESHAGKIVDRKWYERNKHIFPASRWEVYNPEKTFEKYTIHGNADHSVKV